MKTVIKIIVPAFIALLLSFFLACEFEGFQAGPDDDNDSILESVPVITQIDTHLYEGGTFWIAGRNFGEYNSNSKVRLIYNGNVIFLSITSWNTSEILGNLPTNIYSGSTITYSAKIAVITDSYVSEPKDCNMTVYAGK